MALARHEGRRGWCGAPALPTHSPVAQEKRRLVVEGIGRGQFKVDGGGPRAEERDRLVESGRPKSRRGAGEQPVAADGRSALMGARR